MTRIALARLGEMLRKQRGQRGIREVAREIDVSPATLSRVERGNVPDLSTFGKICKWLKLDPAQILGLEDIRPSGREGQEAPLIATAHFRAGQAVKPELASALAQMILAAQRMMAH